MKLLLDQNLSPDLVASLRDLFPGSTHVRDLGLSRADDLTIWTLAQEQGFTIVSKDSDFHQMSFLMGAPPKVIWIRLGNCTTDQILSLLRKRHADIEAFMGDPEAAFLSLG